MTEASDAAVPGDRASGSALSREWRAASILALLGLGAALRGATVGSRSFWRDEIFTLDLVHLPFVPMLRAIPGSEGTPPAYYVVAWAWTRVAGDGEAAVRSLSALAGTLTVAAAYLAGRWLLSQRAGIVAAALTAASPLLVWYAQEARSYALGELAVAASLAALARLLTRPPTVAALAAWVACSAVALTTHYFTGFVIAGQAAWLLSDRGRRRRGPVVAIAAVAAIAVSLAPLALAQRGNPAWIERMSLVRRFVQVPAQFLVGPQPSVQLLAPLALVPVLVAAWILVARATARERRAAVVAGTIGLAGIGLPLVLALAGVDFFHARNVSFAWPPLTLAAAVALASSRSRQLGAAAAVAVVALWAGIDIATSKEPKFGSEDWRAAAAAAGDPAGPRATVVSPFGGVKPYAYYRNRARDIVAPSLTVSEIVVVALPAGDHPIAKSPKVPHLEDVAPPPGFRVTERRRARTFALARFRATVPTHVTANALAALAPADGPALLVERG